MKTFFLFAFVILLSFAAQASGEIPPERLLEYVYGNQIAGSRLIIYSNGSVRKQERTCCPPTIKRWPPFDADKDSLNLLMGAVIDLPTHPYASFESGISNPGSSAGTLFIFGESQNPILIRSIERGPNELSPRTVTVNQSSLVKEIEKLVNRIVEVKMDY